MALSGQILFSPAQMSSLERENVIQVAGMYKEME
jgi:hypothetical protein